MMKHKFILMIWCEFLTSEEYGVNVPLFVSDKHPGLKRNAAATSYNLCKLLSIDTLQRGVKQSRFPLFAVPNTL